MAGYGLGFGSLTSSRQYAALGQNVPAPALLPGENWDGTAGSGFAAPPTDPVRTSAKPVCRLLMPPNQYFTEELVVGVWAAANQNGSLLDDLGLEKVIAHYEGRSFEIAAPSYYLHEDANGAIRRYLGWFVVLQHSGLSGHAQIYFEAVPKDPSMQHRLVGPFEFSPQPTLHDYTLELAPSQSELVGVRYQSLPAALNYLTAAAAQNPLITFTEPYVGDLAAANLYAGGNGYCTIKAQNPVTFKKPGFATGAAALFRPRVDGLWFCGGNITIDFHHAAYIYHENPANRPHVFDGVNITDSGGRYYTYLGAQKPVPYIARDRPWFLECDIEIIQDPCNSAALVRGCTLRNGHRDVASAAYCVIGNSISGWSSDEWRAQLNALSVQYVGTSANATLELTGGNETNGRVLTARQNGAAVASFTIFNSEADYFANTNYTVQNVVDWLNTLPDWSAQVLDNSRRASALSIAGKSGSAFAAQDAKTTPLTLVTMFDQHGDIWALDASSADNVVFADNICFANTLQSLFVGPPVGLRDCIVANNAFDQDEASPDYPAFISQILAPCSHLVIAHNSWSNQLLTLRADLTFNPDAYCLLANNVLPQLSWSGSVDGDMQIADNHLFTGASAPGGATGTVTSGTKSTLFADPSMGDFTPTGALLASPKAPLLRFDAAGIARGIPAAVGALAGGGEVAPAITSANPSGSYAEGSAIGGQLTANKPVNWSVGGPDAAAIVLNGNTGDWSMPGTDFETKSSFSFTFTATDAQNDSDEQTVAIQLLDVDEIAPVLSMPQAAPSGTSGANISVTTDEGNGTLFWYLSTSPAVPSHQDLLSGNGALASGSSPVIASGSQLASANGLTAGTTYHAFFLHRDGAGNNSIITPAPAFATDQAGGGTVSVISHASVLNSTDSVQAYSSSPFPYSGATGNVLIAVISMTQHAVQHVTDMTVSAGAQPMVLLAGAAHSDGGSRPMVGVFAASGLSAGNKVVAMQITERVRSCSIAVMEVANLDIANLLANSASLQATGQTYGHSYTPSAAGNLIISALATRRGAQGPMAPDPGMIEIQDISTGATATSDHTAFVGYSLAANNASTNVGATPALDPDSLFLVAELNAL